MAKTTTDLINNVKRRCQLPDDGGTLSDADILAFASDELQNIVAPRLMSIEEWHYAYSYSITLSSVRAYRLSPRAAGNAIISVEYLDGTNYRFIRLKHPLLQRQDLGENYAIYGNQIVLSDSCPSTGTLRIRAMYTPSSLVTTGCTVITGAASTTLTVTSSAGFSSGQFVDVQYGDSPYEIILMTSVSSVPDGTHVIVADALPADIASGPPGVYAQARLCPAGTSDRVMLPDEAHDFLAQKVAIRCMEARGFTQDMNNHLKKMQDMELAFNSLFSPRSKGEFKAIVREDWLFIGRV